MKKIFLFFLLGFFVSYAFAQPRTEVKITDLKKEITDLITKDYPDYKIIQAFKVDRPENSQFVVVINKEKSRISLIFDKNGKFLNKIEPPKKSTVATEDLKKEIKEYVTKNFKDFNIANAVKIEDKGILTFKVLIEKEKGKDNDPDRIDLIFDKNGKFIKKMERKRPEPMKKNERKIEPKKQAIFNRLHDNKEKSGLT